VKKIIGTPAINGTLFRACSFLVISANVIHIEDVYSVFRILGSNDKVYALSERQTVVLTSSTSQPEQRVKPTRYSALHWGQNIATSVVGVSGSDNTAVLKAMI
jgi:hypothetical protein